MPTYEFRCPLGHEFERFYRSIGTAEAQTICPECGQMAERFMSVGGGLVFKGSGFYLTDYGKNAHQKKAPTDSKTDGAKSDGARAEGGKSEGASSASEGGSSDSSGASKSSDAKPAESKPATPPKPSSGE
jgi:putative FmdB family regulatory protein